MQAILNKFVNIPYKWHLFFSFCLRVILIIYGNYHDQISSVPYTDIDYKVFTDASRHILNNKSPYERHTYRYSPLIAIFLIPNITLHHCFGKTLFSLIDIIVAVLIRLIVKNTIQEYDFKCKKSQSKPNANNEADISMLCWLYNPLTIAIGTRGNCDSLAGFFVLLTLYFIECKKQYFIAGLIHGVSVHFRLYPIIYSLALYMYLSKYSFYSTEDRKFALEIEHTRQIKNTPQNTLAIHPNEKKTIFKMEYLMYLVPNFDQFKLISGCLIALSSLTALFYHLYGYQFLYETYIYHAIRKDVRHNFSMYFYLQYLTAWVKNIGVWQKILTVLPQTVLLLVLSCRFGLNKYSLNFCILTQTIVMVIYNSVLTSQYFVWVMAVLPLCIWQIKMPLKGAIFLIAIWFIAQAAWLLPAYLLEFQGQNTFLYIWLQGVSFFCTNFAILGRFVMYFMPIREKLD